jgi:hypothetical protein
MMFAIYGVKNLEDDPQMAIAPSPEETLFWGRKRYNVENAL